MIREQEHVEPGQQQKDHNSSISYRVRKQPRRSLGVVPPKSKKRKCPLLPMIGSINYREILEIPDKSLLVEYMEINSAETLALLRGMVSKLCDNTDFIAVAPLLACLRRILGCPLIFCHPSEPTRTSFVAKILSVLNGHTRCTLQPRPIGDEEAGSKGDGYAHCPICHAHATISQRDLP